MMLRRRIPGGWHLGAPVLWLQSDSQQQASYLQARDRLLAGVPSSELLVVGGTSHTSFTDLAAYLYPLGRGLTGDDGTQALAWRPTVRRHDRWAEASHQAEYVAVNTDRCHT